MEVTATNAGPFRAGKSRTDGRLDLSLRAGGQGTMVGRLYQQAPLRVLFPHAENGEPLIAVMVNSSGGVVGGDRLDVNVAVGEGASVLVTGQAAEKVYRSSGLEAEATITLSAGPGSRVEYLPQGTIVFDGARFRRVTTIDASPGSRVMAGEVLSLGRVERGERFTRGFLHDEWRVRVNGRLAWADALHLSDANWGGITTALDSPAGFAGSSGYATFVYVGSDATDHVELARRLQSDTQETVRAGVTSFDGLLVARWLGANPADVRGAFGRFWSRFRADVCGAAERLPTIWNI